MLPGSDPPDGAEAAPDDAETRKSPLSVRGGQAFVRNRPSLIFMSGERAGQGQRMSRGELVLGRGRSCNIRFDDEGVSRAHAKLVVERGRVIIEDLQSRNGTLVNGKPVARQQELKDGDKIQLGPASLIKFVYTDPLDESLQEQLYSAAMRDPLTRVFNRSYLTECLDKEFAYARRHGSPMSLMMTDIDYFKKVNDAHGHLAGDAVLKNTARVLLTALRTEDVLARYGGEEFCIICRGISSADASTVAERLRRSVESTAVHLEDGTTVVRVTLSIGLATYPDVRPVTATDFLRVADIALGRAKERGRNRVVPATLEDPLEQTAPTVVRRLK